MRKERIVDLDNLKVLFRSDTEKTIDSIYKDYREEFLNFGIGLAVSSLLLYANISYNLRSWLQQISAIK